MVILNKIAKLFGFKGEIIPEKLTAYYHKLPQKIEVSWFRDNGYIIGTIITDNKQEIYTQGKNAEDFVDMVNDCIFTAYGIDLAYRAALAEKKSYKPTVQEWKLLNDGSTNNSIISLEKQLVVA